MIGYRKLHERAIREPWFTLDNIASVVGRASACFEDSGTLACVSMVP